MKKLLLASTMIASFAIAPALAQDTGAEAGGGASAGAGAASDAGGTDAGAGADAGVDAGADTDAGGADAGVDAGADADVDTGMDGGADAGADTEVDGALQGGADVETGGSNIQGDGGAVDDPFADVGDAADGFFMDETRAEAAADADITSTFSSLTAEEQQAVLDACAEADTSAGATADVCTVVISQQ